MDKINLLMPTDGSAASAQAARFVASYRGERSRTLQILLNVQSPPLRAWPAAGIDQHVTEAALRAQGERELGPARAILAEAGIASQAIVQLGHPSATIIDEAHRLNVDAIVMGTRGSGAIRGFALGSVALSVSQHAESAVVLVKPDAKLPRELGRRLRVVLPVDGSEHARKATVRIAEWAAWLGELHVDIVHCRAPITYLELILPPHDDALALWSDRESDEAVARAKKVFAASGIEHEVHMLEGEPAAEIVKFATVCAADLVAMSTRGLGATHHAFVGSVALKVAHLSAVPVAFMR